jgi:hypothetical protein
VIQEATLFVQRYERAEATVGGLVRLHSLPTLRKLAHSRRWLSFAQAVNQLSTAAQISRKRLWYEFGFKEMDGIRQYRHWRSQRHPQPAERFPYFNPDFLERINYRQRHERFEPLLPPPQSEREFQWRALTAGTMVLPLEVVDSLSAVHSVETRHPRNPSVPKA